MNRNKISNLFDEIEKKTVTADDQKIDTGKVFSLDVTDKAATVGKWFGYIKSDIAGVHTFTLTQTDRFKKGGFALRVNDSVVIDWAQVQCSKTVSLEKGYNKIEIVCRFGKKDQKVAVEYVLTDHSEAQRINLTPGQMFHDKPAKKDVAAGK